MGKQSRRKAASTKEKNQQHHAHHPDLAAPKPLEMEAVAAPDAASQKTVAAGRILEVKATSRGPSLAPSSPSAVELQHLRTLNGILAKQMVEARQERDQDRVLLSDLERGAIRVALASQLSQEAGRLARLAEERGRAQGAEAEARWADAVAMIEEKNMAAREENARLRRDLRELAEEKAEVEGSLRAAETEVSSIRGSLQDARKAVERAQEEKDGFKKDLHKLLLERDEIRKRLDAQTEEKNCLEEARGALERARSDYRALAEFCEEKETALELLAQGKASLEKSLAESLQLVDDLRRQMREAVLAKEEELSKVAGERDEAREGLHLRTQEMKDLLIRVRQAATGMLEHAVSKCQPLEEAPEGWERDLELLMGETDSEEKNLVVHTLHLMDKLSRNMATTIQIQGEELERREAEMKRAMSTKEEEHSDLARTIIDLRSELVRRQEVNKLLKAEEELLRSQVAELTKKNGDAQKLLEKMQAEFKSQAEEKEEGIRSYQSQAEGYLLQISDLMRKMEDAAEEKDGIDKVRLEREGEIAGLQERVAQLSSEIAALQLLCGEQAREKEQLRAEKKDAVRRLVEQAREAEALTGKLRDLERGKRDAEQELRRVEAANAELLEEKEQREWHARCLEEEKASAERSLADAQWRLEVTDRKLKAVQDLTERLLSAMKGVAAEMAHKLGGRGGEVTRNAADTDEEMRPFAVEMEAISRGVRSREVEVEDMNRELKRQREWVASAHRANARWKWLSSAMALATALVSIAFAASGGKGPPPPLSLSL
uniref:Myosin-9 n=1 Tax=Anthurium amnicola TaxID=1678845 RepID=A0A1D1ZDK8_9ARAE